MRSEELYKEAYSRHHDDRDLDGARLLYEDLLARFPDSDEARHAKAQLMAIQRTSAPPPLPSPSVPVAPSVPVQAPAPVNQPAPPRSNWFPWALAVVASCVATWALVRPPGLGGRTTWEYEVSFFEDRSLRGALERRGEAGWEIATCRRATNALDDVGYECIMQRPK